MTNRTIQLSDELYEYLTMVTLREPDLFRSLREETAKMENANLQIAPEQGQFMALLIELLGASRALEIGTFTGYSALWIASALPDQGLLIACDVNKEWTSIAQRYWKQAGVAHKIDLRMGPASETLGALSSDPQIAPFDFAFIDADKVGYDGYYEQTLKLLRPGGLIAFDNALSDGKVADASVSNPSIEAIRAVNQKVSQDVRVSSSLVPIGDGVLLARKR